MMNNLRYLICLNLIHIIFIQTLNSQNLLNKTIKGDWSLYKICNEFVDGIGRELGIQSGKIRQEQFSASSHTNKREPHRAVLNSNSCWRPKIFDSNQYLTIDLERRTLITGIATQGRGSDNEYVTRYMISYSNDGINWLIYTDANKISKNFIGNSDASSVRINNLTIPIVARWLRIHPREWNYFIALRIELYGCSYDSLTVSFDKHRVAYYDARYIPISSYQNVVRLKFKTDQTNGVLFYTKSDLNNDYYLIELRNGSIFVGIDLGSTPDTSGEIIIKCSSFLDDDQFHDVEIRHDFNYIRVTVDQTVCKSRASGHFYCLNVDTRIYVGGVPNHYERGLATRSNFLGCIEDMLIILLDESMHKIDIFNGIRNNLVYYGIENGSHLSYFCPNPVETHQFSFRSYNSFISLYHNEISTNELTLKLEFRTFEPNCLIFFHQFSISKDKFSLSNQEYVSIYLLDAKLTFDLSFKSRKISFQHNSLSSFERSNLNDGKWHSLSLHLTGTFLNLTIDFVPEIAKFNFKFFLGNIFYFAGYEFPISSLNRVKSLVGCLRNVKLNSVELTKDNVKTHADVELNGCKIIDRCNPNPCENNGKCKQDYYSFSCDCSETGGYGGAVCHTAIYPLSCLDFKFSKLITNNDDKFYHYNHLNDFIDSNNQWYEEKETMIDVDGSGPLKPFQVTCKFGTIHDSMNVTLVDHLIEPDTIVPTGHQSPGSYEQKIVYKADMRQIKELILRSFHCSQYVQYKCIGSRLLNWPNEPFGYWTSVNNQKMKFWGESESIGRCGCSLRASQTCSNPAKFCNCDSGDMTRENIDSGYITRKENLPIIKVNFGDTGPQPIKYDDRNFNYMTKSAKYTVGPLVCEGDSLYNNEVTFRKTDAALITEVFANYNEENGAMSFDLRFEFKTAKEHGIFLQSVGPNGDFIELRLQSKYEINFRYNAGRGTQLISIVTPYDLTDLNWHKIQIERNSKQSVLMLDMFSKTVNEDEFFRPFFLNNKLFVGSSVLFKDGYVGCLRALLVNGRFVDLIDLAKRNMYGISIGCVGKCESRPCFNNGVCLEYYDSYKCDCTFTPFRGPTCTTEIGVYMEPDNYIKYTIPNIGFVASEEELIQASFSSYLKTGIIMQILSDNKLKKDKNEYISIEINNNGGIRVKFNFGFDSFEFNSPMFLCNGQNHHVRVRRDMQGRRLNISINDYKPFIFYFDKAQDFDLMFDSPRYIYIGRNETIPDDKGIMGCVSRLQYNRLFPLKFAFMEKPDPNIKIVSIKPIRDRMCNIEPVMIQNEPVEVPPNHDIKIVNFHDIKGSRQNKAKQDVGIKLLAFILVILCIIFYSLAYLIYKRLFSGGSSYETGEDQGAKHAKDADSAFLKFDRRIIEQKEWFYM